MDENLMLILVNASFSFAECRWFLNRNFDDCLHVIGRESIRKALVIQEQPVLLDITFAQSNLRVNLLKGENSQDNRLAITAYVQDWFDLERDLTPFYALLRQHPNLSYMSDDFIGLRLIGIPDLFEALCWGIIGQQINLTFAYKLKRRLVERYGTALTYDHTIHYLFPTAEVLADASPEALRAMQFSSQKTAYLMAVAQAFASGRMSKSKLLALPDLAARQQALIALKGVGIWTANYALMKSLKEQSSIPYGDAGLLNALVNHQVMKEKKDLTSLEKLFQAFAGWESYLVFYLWRSLAKIT